MKKSIFTKAALLFIVAVTTLSVNAQVQTSSFKISMQGVLKNFDGSIVDDGDYSVEFRLYDAVSAGNELWMEPVTIQTNGGLYNTYLGSTALGLSQLQNLLFDMPYYLGITIVGSNEMSPRMELTGNPYAIRANRANTANGLDLGGATITSSGGDLLLGAATTADEVVIATGNLNTGTNDIFTDQITASQGLFGEGVYVKNNYTNEKLLLGAISANDSFVYSDGAGDLNFAAKSGKVYSTSVLHLTNNSNVLAHTGYRLDQNGASPETGYTAATGLVCNNSIKAQGFHATSDRRIKKDFKLSSAKNDLSLVNSIKVTDYKFIDKASHRSKEIKGVIAQEVKEVLPNAINQSEGFVPSIYKNAIAVVFIGENIEITMAEAHNLKAGELVRVIT
ncbi:MAG: tail fiber domain-containing protein, partial [Flavobacteriales bacterium]|nr:tail fiber domain-containing protein [Flavobacteriales bacterium]